VKTRYIATIVLAFLTVGLDQITKLWARTALRGHSARTLIANYLDFEYHENTGMAFSLGRDLPGGRIILIGVGIIVLVIVWRVVRRIEQRRHLADVAFGLVAGGAIGNLIDRARLGRVVDFILMHWQHKYRWPAYNVADIALVVGVALLLIALQGQPKTQASSRQHKRPKRQSR